MFQALKNRPPARSRVARGFIFSDPVQHLQHGSLAGLKSGEERCLFLRVHAGSILVPPRFT